MGSALSRIRLRSRRVSARTEWYVVEVVTDDGLIGYGECSDIAASDGPVEIVAEAATLIGQLGDGADPMQIDEILQSRVRSIPQGRRRHTLMIVFGGLVAAVCDIAARSQGMPLGEWLGGRPTASVDLYANINRAAVGQRTPDRFATVARSAVSAGFRSVKVAPFDALSPGTTLKAGLKILSAVRSSIGGTTALLVDLHKKLDRRDLLEALPVMEDLGVGWVEDAVDVRDTESLAWLAAETHLPLAGGERLTDRESIRTVCETGLLTHLLLDPKYVGGPLQFRTLVSEVTDDVSLTIHDPTGPISTLVSAHCSTLVVNGGPMEFSYGEIDGRADVVVPRESVVNGRLKLPALPGAGARLSDSDLWQRLADIPLHGACR